LPVSFFWRLKVSEGHSSVDLTLRAQKSLQLANQEAHRLNHHILGTEHLLLGLAKEGVGLASILLKGTGCCLGHLRCEVQGSTTHGPARNSLGRLTWDAAAQNAIQQAIHEAKDLNHAKVGSGHRLLGLVSQSQAKGAQILEGIVSSLTEFRAQIVTGLNFSNWAYVENFWDDEDNSPPLELVPPPGS
jgi:ATP-dependent Clp protease ATP-binding subunit ClpC